VSSAASGSGCVGSDASRQAAQCWADASRWAWRVWQDTGGTALKTLVAYVKNIVENPAEEKFRSINVENKAFKTRVAPVVGCAQVFKALGFVKDEAEGKYVLGDPELGLLGEARARLEAAVQAFERGA
jgi:hypothetical protein